MEMDEHDMLKKLWNTYVNKCRHDPPGKRPAMATASCLSTPHAQCSSVSHSLALVGAGAAAAAAPDVPYTPATGFAHTWNGRISTDRHTVDVVWSRPVDVNVMHATWGAVGGVCSPSCKSL